ncbi:MAG: branched-chain amino acid transaminase [Anaerolineae bacterium]|nr:branched-chain amino acid transaminase [Anaerolineae bacterium]
MSMPKYAFFQGKIVPIEQAKVSVMNHALNYGTAAFGGMRAYWNDDEKQLFLFRPIDHFNRLRNSGKLLMIDLPWNSEQLRDILCDLLRTEDFHENVYIRPLIYKSMEGIGVKLHDVPGDFTMFAFPFGNYITADNTAVKVGFSSWTRINDNMIPARGKIAGAYVNSALIKTEAELNGFDEALVLNESGHVSEASSANFFIVRNGKAITPPLSADILEGITRTSVIALLREVMGVEVVEREIDRTEVYLAEEAFFCGTGVQVAAVTSVDHRPIGTGKMGPMVEKLREVFFKVVTGKIPEYRHWTHPVYVTEPVKA